MVVAPAMDLNNNHTHHTFTIRHWSCRSCLHTVQIFPYIRPCSSASLVVPKFRLQMSVDNFHSPPSDTRARFRILRARSIFDAAFHRRPRSAGISSQSKPPIELIGRGLRVLWRRQRRRPLRWRGQHRSIQLIRYSETSSECTLCVAPWERASLFSQRRAMPAHQNQRGCARRRVIYDHQRVHRFATSTKC